MDQIVDIVLSWQFILVAAIVFIIFGFFNGVGKWKGIGYYLWKTNKKPIRKFLKFMEATKQLYPVGIGFGLGWIPQMPIPDALSDSSTLTVALLYAGAGLLCSEIVKAAKGLLSARGINVDVDLSPREQTKSK